jgi:hypothetical protein
MTHRFPPKTGASRTGGRYDYQHQQARKRAAAKHHPTDTCTRCGQPLGPMGRQLHYDHAEDGTYLGFAHARCNIEAGAAKGNALANNQPIPAPTRRRTRTW